MLNTSLKAREDEKRRDDMHEIMYSGEMPESSAPSTKDPDPFDKIQIRTAHQMEMKELTQSVIYAYMYVDPLSDQREFHLARLFNSYFGGDM